MAEGVDPFEAAMASVAGGDEKTAEQLAKCLRGSLK